MKMKIFTLVTVLVFFVISCASIPGSKWNIQKKADEYFVQNPDRIEYKQYIDEGEVAEGMTKQEVKFAVRNRIYAPTIQEKDGYYQGIGCTSYFLVGDYKGEAPNMWFDAYLVVFFEDGICTGWQRL
jgi:hypothetical protein